MKINHNFEETGLYLIAIDVEKGLYLIDKTGDLEDEDFEEPMDLVGTLRRRRQEIGSRVYEELRGTRTRRGETR